MLVSLWRVTVEMNFNYLFLIQFEIRVTGGGNDSDLL